jgi:hypothetical protein
MANGVGGANKSSKLPPAVAGPSRLGGANKSSEVPPPVADPSGLGLKKSYVSVMLQKEDGQVIQHVVWPRKDVEKGEGTAKVMMIQLSNLEEGEFNSDIVWQKKLIVQMKTRKPNKKRRYYISSESSD